MLLQRPAVGIWGGLWSFPECPPDRDVCAWCRDELGYEPRDIETWPVVRHTFSHFHLDITPVRIEIGETSARVMEQPGALWYNTASRAALGLATPVKRLIRRLEQENVT